MVAASQDQIVPGRAGGMCRTVVPAIAPVGPIAPVAPIAPIALFAALIAAFLSAAPPSCAAPAAAARASASPALSTPSKPIDYFCYSPYRDDQAPGGASPTEAQIRADLALIAPLAKGIRTYSVGGILSRIPDLAREAGLEVYAGAWVGTDDAANLAEVDALIALAKAGNPALKGLIVGNEVLLRHDVTAARLQDYLRRVRDAKTGIPVTTADIYQDLNEHAAELNPLVDFALCHAHPYWEDVAAGDGAARVLQAWISVKANYPGKPVLVGETGFPTLGPTRGAAVPNEAAQARFVGDLLAIAAREGMPVMWFEAFDEPWKGDPARTTEGPIGAHWGLWNSDRSEKPALAAARATTGVLRPMRDGRVAEGGRSDRGGLPELVLGARAVRWDPVPSALWVDAAGRLRAAR
jgi:exo-beta-1,3-glucanase (GH17 family)